MGLIGMASSTSQFGSGGASQFMHQHEVTLRKNRNHFLAQVEQYMLDYRLAHQKSLAELPVLQEQFNLEVSSIMNRIDYACGG